MSITDNQTTNNIASDNWADNLLVKDKDGVLRYHKSGKKAAQTNLGGDTDNFVKSSINTAPADDSFVADADVSGPADSKSELVFHPEDKRDIAEAAASSSTTDNSKKYGVEKIVDRLIEKHSIKLDKENQAFFTDAIYNFFRNRKNAIVTRDVLSNKIKSNQGNLSPDNVDSIMSVIKGLKSEIDNDGGLVVRISEMEYSKVEPTKKKDDIPVYELAEGEAGKLAEDEIKEALEAMVDSTEAVETKVSKGSEEESVPTIEIEKKQEDKPTLDKKSVDINKPKGKFDLPDESQEKKSPTAEEEKKEETVITSPEIKSKVEPLKVEVQSEPASDKDKEPEPSLPTVSRPSKAPVVKKQVSDVVSAKRPMTTQAPSSAKDVLTGPVKELQSMDLLNFRRLGNTATDRADKILEKINLLEQDSYTKKAQGVAGWRNSPVYKQYLELGADSMINGQEVSALIEQNKTKGKDTLELEEFSAISDLNKKLRF